MADNIKGIPFRSRYEGIDVPFIARDLAYQTALSLRVKDEHPTFSIDEVYVVWFSFTLGNWKALCSTSLPDGRYYEITFNRDSKEAYVDAYVKTHQQVVSIEF